MNKSNFKIKFVIITLIICLTSTNYILPIAVSATEEENYVGQYQLQQGATRFYIVNLTAGSNLILNCTAFYKGVFYIYLFNERPENNYILKDGTLDPTITEKAVVYNETPSLVYSSNLNDTVSSVTLNFTATSYRLYYIEIIIIENGPDTYKLESSKKIEEYYIPFIAGFNLEIFFGCIFISAFLIQRKIHRKRRE